ncbi:DUF397 domain-containing protein [Streptomyces cinereospinus]|uniref:DUF397 domain-containing protein n=1 Tax=Streptomyces cinereospinus TaxID=285561 RepID=A0ABV5MX49_9ACTN
MRKNPGGHLPSRALPPATGGGGPCTEGCVTLARIGEDAWALGDSKRPDAQPLRFTTEELDAAGIDPARFGPGA